ncbi:hypothetical protein CDA63_06025 [Hymenobacter amundsenii]|uniref:Uncharacterized protein n=1 Tax=Hymenobacter amundsenii TaxID=2006685 RepID=A0A246FMW3_9BACT|nr:hypothetical protein [Hymenobacter amundsenii]OWP64019.1 hypothetical protein CDA63_06025 [Hymenobacter amundsenii]
MEARRGTGWWYAALGASAVSAAIIGVAYLKADAGYWLRYGSLEGWTIYPLLADLPQSIAHAGPDYISNLRYDGLMLAAVVAMATSGSCWLVSVVRDWGRGALRPVRWLPVLLALPAAVHAGADEYHFRQPYDPASHPLPNFDSLRAVLR